jgi:thioredoxin-like negative regulator of GroEL
MSAFVTKIENNQFDQQMHQQAKPVILDFWDLCCGSGKAMAPAFATLAGNLSGQNGFHQIQRG